MWRQRCCNGPCCSCTFRDDDFDDAGGDEQFTTSGLVGVTTSASQSSDGSTINCVGVLSTPWTPCREVSADAAGDPVNYLITRVTAPYTIQRNTSPFDILNLTINATYNSGSGAYEMIPTISFSVVGNLVTMTVTSSPGAVAVYQATVPGTGSMPFNWTMFTSSQIVFTHVSDDGSFSWPATITLSIGAAVASTCGLHYWRFYDSTTWTPAGTGPTLGACIDFRWLSGDASFYGGGSPVPLSGDPLPQLALKQGSVLAIGTPLGPPTTLTAGNWKKRIWTPQVWASWFWAKWITGVGGETSTSFTPDISPGAPDITFGISCTPGTPTSALSDFNWNFRIDQFCFKRS